MPAKVILVEDDPDDRELFGIFYAEREDVELLPSVGNGIELIHYLQAILSDPSLPDLIVLDQNMPMMTGMQTLEFLKADGRFSRIPVVIYSTYTDNNLIRECTRLGAHGVAVKPIDHDGYQKMMNEFLSLMMRTPE